MPRSIPVLPVCLWLMLLSVVLIAADIKLLSHHILVIDAGSSGTSLHVMKFYWNMHSSGLGLRVASDERYTVKPGLSSYFSSPRGGAGTVLSLISALGHTTDYSRKDNILVRGSDGLRFASQGNLENIQALMSTIKEAVNQVFKGRYVIPVNGARMILDKSQANYAWLAANFLSHKLLPKQGPSASYGILNMGGSSSQIAFQIEKSEIGNYPEGETSRLVALDNTYYLYSQSYLGLGGNSFKQFLLKVSARCQTEDCAMDSDLPFSSDCLHPDYVGAADLGRTFVNVRGKAISDSKRFFSCYAQMSNIVRKISKVGALAKNRNFYALGGYNAILKDLGLTSTKKPEPVSLYQILSATTEACQNPPTEGIEKPFICMNACYMLALLREGFGFDKYKKIIPVEELIKIPVEWAVGLGISETYREISSGF